VKAGGGRLTLVAAFVALVLAGAAQGSATPLAHQLSIMPLSQAAIGSAAKGLPLAQGSGVVTNADAADDANGDVTAKTFANLGRVTGYELDYGFTYGGGPGVEQIGTGVELYRDSSSAARGFAFWRRDEVDLSPLRGIAGFSVTIGPRAGPRLGNEAAAFAGKAALSGFLPLYGVDVFFRVGRVLAKVSVTAGTASLSERVAPELASALYSRIRRVLSGSLRGQPASLAAVSTAGPPPGGPNLAALALQTSDLGGGTVTSQGYELDRDFAPVSEYDRQMQPGGSFASVDAAALLMHSPKEASFFIHLVSSTFRSPSAMRSAGMHELSASVVRVSGGDEALAVLTHVSVGGRTTYVAVVDVRVGAVAESMTVGTARKIPPSALAALARIAAKRLEASR
jgi:hypothetical protein